MEDRKLYHDEAAKRAGVTAATWRRYASKPQPGRKRQAPEPDGTDIEDGKARPWWRTSTIDAYIAQRPGKGSPGKPRTRMGERLRQKSDIDE